MAKTMASFLLLYGPCSSSSNLIIHTSSRWTTEYRAWVMGSTFKTRDRTTTSPQTGWFLPGSAQRIRWHAPESPPCQSSRQESSPRPDAAQQIRLRPAHSGAASQFEHL